jgi:hypothetical protein
MSKSKLFTLADAVAYANGEKTKKGRKWENDCQSIFVDNGLLPEGDISKSLFKKTTFDFVVKHLTAPIHRKITDFYLPKFNQIIECKDGLSDSTEQAIYFSVNSLIESNQFGPDFKFVLLLKYPEDNKRRAKSLVDFAKNCPNFEVYIGKEGVKEYAEKISKNKITSEELPMGDIVWCKFKDLIDNDKNRPKDWEHVYKLVDSILTETSSGSVRGLLRTFIGFKSKNGKIHLVDAHHLKAACEIINNYTKYQIDEVPVYTLDHLSHLSEEEMSSLMSIINVLVLKWSVFAFVKLWEKTYHKLMQENDSYESKWYPYNKLAESMEDLQNYLDLDDASKAPCVQAFCFNTRADEGNWGSNTRQIHDGVLSFDEKTYNNKLRLIIESQKKLADFIDKTRKVVGSSYKINPNSKDTISTPKKTMAILKAFATELSIQETEVSSPEVYSSILKELSNGYWENQTTFPSWDELGDYEVSDFKKLALFPTTGDEMKHTVKDKIVNEAKTLAKRKK